MVSGCLVCFHQQLSERIYKGQDLCLSNTKVVCFPGLNCYSCPGALLPRPMGALKAVMGDVTYRISLYVSVFCP